MRIDNLTKVRQIRNILFLFETAIFLMLLFSIKFDVNIIYKITFGILVLLTLIGKFLSIKFIKNHLEIGNLNAIVLSDKFGTKGFKILFLVLLFFSIILTLIENTTSIIGIANVWLCLNVLSRNYYENYYLVYSNEGMLMSNFFERFIPYESINDIQYIDEKIVLKTEKGRFRFQYEREGNKKIIEFLSKVEATSGMIKP